MVSIRNALASTMMSLVAAGCGSAASNPLEKDEEKLGTGGDLAKYHYLVREPYSIGLQHEGFIIGIEKSPKEDIGYRGETTGGRGLDTIILKPWTAEADDSKDKHLVARNDHLRKTLDDGKSAYISHILQYGPDTGGTARFNVHPVYVAYSASGFPDGVADHAHAPKSDTPNYYKDTWAQLDLLEGKIGAILSKAKTAGNRYTHVIVASMGWNNDQVESVRRYNALLGNVIARARIVKNENIPAAAEHTGTGFNPLIIGFTWPSVWGGDSFFNAINKVLHVGSYMNKANDADEIGYTIANYLVNHVLHRLKAKHKFKLVLIGHSMGARILSRAMLSAHLLADSIEEKSYAADLLIGLQGAFSVRRFENAHETTWPTTMFSKGEGSPYLLFNHPEVRGKIVLTWSEFDQANPLAQLLTGAAHVGGDVGYKESKDIPDTFEYADWSKSTPDPALRKNDQRTGTNDTQPWNCEAIGDKPQNHKRVLMINAGKIVTDHNDILDPEMGRLIWNSIACFAATRQ